MLAKRIVTVITITSALSLGIAHAAHAWSATLLGNQLWAITCANGTSSAYQGSSAGLDIVGPTLCPGGVIATGPVGSGKVIGKATNTNLRKSKDLPPTSVVLPKGVTRGIPANVDPEVLQNKKEVGDSSMQSVMAK
jgi:hypothetical protein